MRRGRPPAAFVLDLALPDRRGTELIAELRRCHRTPIIALSSPASTADKIAALDAGADQYVTAPFPMDEFLARLRALLRRDKGHLIRGQNQSVIGHWQVDLAAHQVTCADAQASPPPAGSLLVQAIARRRSMPGPRRNASWPGARSRDARDRACDGLTRLLFVQFLDHPVDHDRQQAGGGTKQQPDPCFPTHEHLLSWVLVRL